MKLNKTTYKKLIQEDIAWLEQNTTDCLEKAHIIDVLNTSVALLFEEKKNEEKEEHLCSTCKFYRENPRCSTGETCNEWIECNWRKR